MARTREKGHDLLTDYISFIVSYERHGKNPLAYLKDILTRLPRMTKQDDLRPLMPVNWQPS